MPSVLPTIPNDPPQGIQALLDKVYLWNPDVSNELIEKVNALLTKLGDAIGAIRPYDEMVAPINQYEPCYYGDGVYVAKNYLAERAEEFNEEDWILIARKGITAEEADEKFLPLSGGRINGVLDLYSQYSPRISSELRFTSLPGGSSTPVLWRFDTSGGDLVIKHQHYSGNSTAITFNAESGFVFPGLIKNIGSNTKPFSVVWANKLANMNVPTLAGTLARLEDLTAGNVSITFAGQEDTLQNAINTLKTDQDELGDQVSAIESKIPADASETNQLVTKNEVLALPTFTYMVVNELPETGEEKIIYLVPKAGEGNDVHDEYIWVNGGYELIGTTAVDLSGYLPLTGGTLTGSLKIKDTVLSQVGLNQFGIGPDIAPDLISISTGGGHIYPKWSSSTLGLFYQKWGNVYTTKLNNGADIAVPTTGGTIALAEDIAESVTTKDLTVGTDEGTLNIGITAGVATIATNNGLDIVSQTKFDTAPTTDDSTAWADVNATALVTKAQVTTALSTAGGGTSVTIRNWA